MHEGEKLILTPPTVAIPLVFPPCSVFAPPGNDADDSSNLIWLMELLEQFCKFEWFFLTNHKLCTLISTYLCSCICTEWPPPRCLAVDLEGEEWLKVSGDTMTAWGEAGEGIRGSRPPKAALLLLPPLMFWGGIVGQLTKKFRPLGCHHIQMKQIIQRQSVNLANEPYNNKQSKAIYQLYCWGNKGDLNVG